MKELSGTARNYYWTEGADDKLKPQVELIVVVSEPQFRLGPDEMIRERVCESYRIGMGSRGVKMLMKELLEIEQELETMEKLTASVSISKEEVKP